VIRVVAAAIVRDDRVLAALRKWPELGWEFPGGKLEAGEDEAAALRRECLEELGAEVRPTRRIGESSNDRIHMTLWQARLEAGEPLAGDDHDAIAWLSTADLDGAPIAGTDWLPLDAALLRSVRGLLG
jgi:8-oxo-dGTP diphosphatase